MERENEFMMDVGEVEEEINNEAMSNEQVEVAVENVSEADRRHGEDQNNNKNNNGGDHNVWELEDMNEMEIVRELIRSTESEYCLRGVWGEWKYEGDLIWREWEMNPYPYYYWNGHQQEEWVVHDLWVYDDHVPNHNNGAGHDNGPNPRAPPLP